MNRVVVFSLVAFLISFLPRSAKADPELEAALKEIHSAEDVYFASASTETLQRYGLELESIYRASIRPIFLGSRLRSLDDPNLKSLFDAMQTVAFYSESASVVKDMERAFREVDRRRLSTPELLRDFNDVCLLVHRQDSCGLAKRFPEARLPEIPRMRFLPGLAASGRVLDISDDESMTTVRGLSWDLGPKILLLTSPGCNPGLLALNDIESDPILRPRFEKNALLIAPTQSVSESGEIVEWNRKHPALRNFIAYSLADWPIFKHWRTPTFIFVRDGEVVYQFGGWTRPDKNLEYRSKLARGMELIGLGLGPEAQGVAPDNGQHR